MRRRDFVRAMVSVGLAPKLLLGQQTANPAPPPPAPVPWTLGLNPKTPIPQTSVADGIAQEDLIFFSPEQMGTLTRLSDVLMPSLRGQPGAIQAETPGFLDFLIGSSPASRRDLYAVGLDWLNAQAQTQYGVPFAQANAAQADALIQPWLRSWMTDHPPTQPHADFLNIAHADIRTATMNSKAWNEAVARGARDTTALGLYWSPIEPDIYAESFNSVHIRPSPAVDAPRSSHTTTAYPH